MTNRTHWWRATETLAQAAVLLGLVLIGLVLLWLTPGQWWVATPLGQRWWTAAAVVVAYAGFCFWTGRHARRSGGAALAMPGSSALGGLDDTSSVLVVYASQTGFAQELAQRTFQALRQAGKAVQMAAIDHLDHARLARGGQVLFVASTTGQGDPPDHARRFVREVMQRTESLKSLEYAILALGDRHYEQFCAFGHHLDRWLRQHQARPLFDLVEVDNADETALERWQSCIGQLSRATASSNGHPVPSVDLQPTSLQPWRVTVREHLNPGSLGCEAYRLALAPLQGESPEWVAGDVVEVLPRNPPEVVSAYLAQLGLDPELLVTRGQEQVPLKAVVAQSELPPPAEALGLAPQELAEKLRSHKCRQYSIASLPDEGDLQLLIRRHQRPDGTPGLCSNWLCCGVAVGQTVELRIRSNPNFHPGPMTRPLILIGNGTGIAGLRAHLQARAGAGQTRNWLLFGERKRDCDFFFQSDLQRWEADGALQRLDLAFSRDQPQRTYVQDKLHAAAEQLRRWVAEGAAIYVCGSAVGMAPAVDQVLRQVLTDDQVDQMLADRRYCRDVY